ncbi:MAG TPA: AraC family transcriptional regulator [Spirochaetota bacterium]
MKYQYLYLIGCSHGLFLSLCLWLRKGRSGRILSVLGVLISFELFVEYRFSVSGFSANKALYHIRESLGFLYGPLIYYYVSAITGSFRGLRARGLSHLILPLLYGVFALTVSREGFLSPASVGMIQKVFCHSKSLVIIIYIAFALMNFIGYSRRIGEYFSNTEQIGFSWLMIFIPVVLAIVTMGEAGIIIRDSGSRYGAVIVNIHFVFIALAVYGVSYLTFIKADKYARIHRMLESSRDTGSGAAAERRKYDKAFISEIDKKRYLAGLRKLLEREELFLDPELTIGQMAKEMNISVNTLSQVINAMAGKNFFRFINDYRVAYSERFLMSDDPEVNILSLAFKSGFNSKSAFYNAFKIKNGVSPLEYMKSRGQTVS